jgi:putative ABC transport system permease protein
MNQEVVEMAVKNETNNSRGGPGDWLEKNWKWFLAVFAKILFYSLWSLFFFIAILISIMLGAWMIVAVLFVIWAVPFVALNDLFPYLVVTFLYTLIFSVFLGPDLIYYILVIGVTAIFITICVLRKQRVFFKIGTRNIYRRKGYTAIVISGLMIGTVIISASLIIGDTMENMITGIYYDIYHEVDEGIYGIDSDFTLTYVDEAEYEELRGEILQVDNVDAVTGEIHESVAVVDQTSQQAEANMRLLGYNTTTPEFGKYYVNGKEVPFEIGPFECYLDEGSGDILDASPGDELIIYTATGNHTFTVKQVIDKTGRSNMAFDGILMPLETAQRILGVGNRVNYIQVTNKGDVYGGEKYCEQVTEDITELMDIPRYNLTYKAFNKVNMGFDAKDLENFKRSTYGNIPDDFVLPDTMSSTDVDPLVLISYDSYLNFTEELIVFEEPLNTEDYSKLSADLGDNRYIDGVTAELDLVFGYSDEEIGVLGLNAHPSFGNLTSNGTEVDLSKGVFVNALSGIQPNTTLNVTFGGATYQLYVAGILDHSSRATTKSVSYIFMDLAELQGLTGLDGQTNVIRISGAPVILEDANEALMKTLENAYLIHEHVKNVFNYNKYKTLEVQENKAEEIEMGREGMSFFTDMFLVFGSFSIIAGVILIINIFVMLGEERKGEMGISRAVGMRRFHLSRSFVYEGSFYAAFSALLGALLGIVVAYVIMYFLDWLFASMVTGINLDVLGSFTFTAKSIILAFTFGFLITLITVSFASWRISKLNIVRAIRNIPEPRVSKKSLIANILGVLMIIVGILTVLLALNTFDKIDFLDAYVTAGFYLGTSVAIFGLGFIIRRFIDDRWAFTIVSLVNIVIWMIPASVLEPILDLPVEESGFEMFILSGLFVVSSAVILFVYNSTQILGIFVKLYSLTGRPTATLKTATSYPMKTKFRTGLTIYMFALIIFTITVMSMIVGMMSYNINRITDEQVGGIEIYGIANSNRIIGDINAEINASDDLSMDQFKGVYTVTAGTTELNTTFKEPMTEEYLYFPMTVYGYDTDFAQDSEWPFELRMEGLKTDRDVWMEVKQNPDLIILDGTFSPDLQMGGGGPDDGNHDFTSPSDIVKVGENVTFRGPNGETVTKTVAGILKQFFINGVFMGKEGAARSFNVTFPAIYMFDLVDDDKADDIAKDIERELGLDTVVLTTLVKEITDMMEQFFNLFSAFMGLGLVVGIAGLGIITLRAVHERRLEIGMMRAIGFKRRSVTFSFMMEASFIALVGIFLGTFFGILIGWNIWYDGFRSIDFEFYIPWTRIIVVGIIAYVATAIFTIPPALMASKVTPAEALRFD